MRSRSIFVGIAAVLFMLSGCDQSFEPLGENDAVFSMFAVLNASADTQWVRVMPVRESVFSEPAPIDARVTLEHLETGHVIELQDSLFKYAGSDPDIVADLYVHNFWTTEPLVRGGTYTVRASRSDGRSAWATVRVPLSVRRVVVSIRQNPHQTHDFLRVESDGHLALLQVLHGEGREVQRQSLAQSGTGAGVSQVAISRIRLVFDPAFVPPLPPRPAVCAQDRICAISMLVSGVEWPFKEDHTEAYVTQADALSNVEEGTGFVGAVLAHEVPYESCRLSPATITLCELVYDETTATLEGTVTDTTCNVRLRGAWVVLRRADGTRTRTTRTRADGSFRIGAIEAGVPHELFVDELENHISMPRTISSFTAGDTTTVAVGVERVGRCPEA
jgi:hypothetical protein